jgi:hypothetical protein
VNGLSGAVLGEVDLPPGLLTGLDADRHRPDQGRRQVHDQLTGAKVQTDHPRPAVEDHHPQRRRRTKFGPSYFLKFDSQDGTVDLKAEGQTFELPAESFSIEIVGSMKIKEGGSSDPNADDAVRLFGGFFLRITPERFEIFVQAEAEIPVLGLNGKAVGLIILDANTSSGPAGHRDDAQPGADAGRVAGGQRPDLGAGRHLRTARFGGGHDEHHAARAGVRDPAELPGPAAGRRADHGHVFYAAAPEIDGSKRVNVPPEIYISANIQGSITLFDTITLTGFISFTAATDVNGNAFVRIAGAVSTNIEFLGSL